MISVGQFDLATDLLEVMSGNSAFDGTLGTHVHKDRGLDYTAVGAGKLAAPGMPLCFDDFEHEKTPIFGPWLMSGPFLLTTVSIHYTRGLPVLQYRKGATRSCRPGRSAILSLHRLSGYSHSANSVWYASYQQGIPY